jgi:hypothetical protein
MKEITKKLMNGKQSVIRPDVNNKDKKKMSPDLISYYL